MDKFVEKYNLPKMNNKEIIKIRKEINEIERKETIAKINTTKVGSLRRKTKLINH